MSEDGRSCEELTADIARLQARQKQSEELNPSGVVEGCGSAELYRLAFEYCPVGMAMALPDGRLVSVNQALCRMLEYSAQELRSLRFYDFTHPDDLPASRRITQDILLGRQATISFEHRMIAKSGRTVWVRLTASLIRGPDGMMMGLGVLEDVTATRQAQQELARNQRRYQQVFEYAGDIICTISRDLRITSISRSVETILAHKPADLIGGKVGTLGIIPTDYLEKAFKDIQQVLDGKPLRHMPYMLTSKTGQRVHVELRGSLLPGEPGCEEIIVVIRDVSRQVKALEALSESEQNCRHLVEQALDGIVIIQDGLIRLANPRILTLLGYSSDEMIGAPYSKFLRPAEAARAESILRDRVSNVDPDYLVMTRLISRNGKLIDFEVSLGPTSFHGKPAALVVLRDATQRNAMENALRRSERLLASIIEQSPVSTWIADSEGTNIRQNEACRQLFGVTDDSQTVGKYNLFKDEVLTEQGLIPRVREVYEKGRTVSFCVDYDFAQVRHVHVPSAQHRLLEVTIFPIKDSRGNVVNAVVQHEDITELAQREEQLRQAQKMEAVGKLAGGIAHDFRNQLTVVNGYCELLLRRLPKDDPSRESVSEIFAAAQRSTTLTSQLLAYSRKQLLQPRCIQLNQLIVNMRNTLVHVLGEDIKLSLDLADDLHQIEADPDQIQQVIMNIVLNARDATAGGGTVTISTANEELDEAYAARHPGATAGPHVGMTIADTGTGMDEETRKRMFDPFFTTKPVGKGTGLGLSTVYGFVRQSGGHISVTSKRDCGTKLKLHFPRLDLISRPQAPAANV